MSKEELFYNYAQLSIILETKQSTPSRRLYTSIAQQLTLISRCNRKCMSHISSEVAIKDECEATSDRNMTNPSELGGMFRNALVEI